MKKIIIPAVTALIALGLTSTALATVYYCPSINAVQTTISTSKNPLTATYTNAAGQQFSVNTSQTIPGPASKTQFFFAGYNYYNNNPKMGYPPFTCSYGIKSTYYAFTLEPTNEDSGSVISQVNASIWVSQGGFANNCGPETGGTNTTCTVNIN